LRAINPQLIYCSITGFGHTGPYAQRAGYDFLIQGMGGLMSITGHPGMGNAHPNTVPYQDFATADGHMILAIGNDGQFARFCDAC
jgi:crotonobetainyl-CoA:carnitine CoA-transferase CaiB-like acyl-CoA transferase